MMTTIEIPNHKLSLGEMLKFVMDVAVPILLTATIISLIVFRVDVAEKFEQTAHTVQTTACVAVRDLAVAHEKVWERQLADAEPRPGQDPVQFQKAIDAFLDDLKSSDMAIYRKCLVTDGTASTREG